MHALDRANNLARGQVHVVVATEVAGVVVRDAVFERCITDIKLACINEVFEELTVVNNFVVAAQLWVFVLQRVETMWALRDDFLHAHAVQHFNVWQCKHLEQILVT